MATKNIVTAQTFTQTKKLLTVQKSSKEWFVLFKKLHDVYVYLATVAAYEEHPIKQNLARWHAFIEAWYNRKELDSLLVQLGYAPTGWWKEHITQSVVQILTGLADRIGVAQPDIAENDYKKMSISGTISRLFAPLRTRQSVSAKPHIMVTMPSEASSNKVFVSDIIDHGAELVRINTAHDTVEDRKVMASFAKVSSTELKRPVMVYTDLASRKMRTAKNHRKFEPISLGGKKEPGRVMITADVNKFTCAKESSQALFHLPTIVLSEVLFWQLEKWTILRFQDIRGKNRAMEIVDHNEAYCSAMLEKKSIIDGTTHFRIQWNKQEVYSPHNIRPQPECITVQMGDTVHIVLDAPCSRGAYIPVWEDSPCPVTLALTDPIVLHDTKPGDHLYIDDWKVWLKITKKHEDYVVCTVTYTKWERTVIKEEKWCNFPDTSLNLPALTEEDKRNLIDVCEFTDIVGISFCQTADDVRQVASLLTGYNKTDIGIVAKIETKKAVKNLPKILEALIEYGNSGVMIARWDLAVEVWFDQLPRVQEHILEVCAAARIPVIYATGIMDKAMKNQLPTRPELIDAYQAKKAACLMLNKWPWINNTLDMLEKLY